MARITVEDCLKQVENRFELVLMASKRARELQKGEEPIVSVKQGEKTTTTALREIASGKFSEEKIKNLKKVK